MVFCFLGRSIQGLGASGKVEKGRAQAVTTNHEIGAKAAGRQHVQLGVGILLADFCEICTFWKLQVKCYD